jgi:hypothetical protein
MKNSNVRGKSSLVNGDRFNGYPNPPVVRETRPTRRHVDGVDVDDESFATNGNVYNRSEGGM